MGTGGAPFSLTSIQLIAVAHPFKADLGDVVECYKVVVTWHTVY
jgi:hypothetical protein